MPWFVELPLEDAPLLAMLSPLFDYICGGKSLLKPQIQNRARETVALGGASVDLGECEAIKAISQTDCPYHIDRILLSVPVHWF
jgi:hypothetical protein